MGPGQALRRTPRAEDPRHRRLLHVRPELVHLSPREDRRWRHRLHRGHEIRATVEAGDPECVILEHKLIFASLFR